MWKRDAKLAKLATKDITASATAKQQQQQIKGWLFKAMKVLWQYVHETNLI
ncbi:hypothetical protein AVDCRST_MAG94-10 [uncultured Leptolyngbya sp.]|uniref:Uncharacterized protein n=1 Tax=uncultured Leptolyngbya sp. TaxID=332963 RepID=A0A6J4K4A1_9CYAN|nr:hypothetical protein AVDCRST_MAG94-10 [uncultured Leptolyngbya sp.]